MGFIFGALLWRRQLILGDPLNSWEWNSRWISDPETETSESSREMGIMELYDKWRVPVEKIPTREECQRQAN